MRETFIRSQRTQSLQNMKERMDAREKTEGKKWKINFFEKMSDGEKDGRTQLNCV